MKKKSFLITAALGLSLWAVGCNKSGKLSEHSTFKTPTGPVMLTLKWPAGERIVQDMDMKQSMDFSIPKLPTPMHQDMTLAEQFGLTVLQATPDGGHEVELEFLSAKMMMTMGGKTLLDYDSTQKSSTDKPNPAGEILGKIIGAKIQYFLNATNGVDRLDGVDQLMERLQSGAQPQVAASVKSMFSDSYFKQLMSANRYLPTKAVQPGDTWTVQIDYPLGPMGTLAMNYDFTFQSWEIHGRRNCARLDFQGTIKSKPEAASSSSPMALSNLEGTSSGSSWFDPEFGIIIDTTMSQDMKMTMKMPTQNRGKDASAPPQDINGEMHQVMNIKLVSVK